jgi:hypothetical protein
MCEYYSREAGPRLEPKLVMLPVPRPGARYLSTTCGVSASVRGELMKTVAPIRVVAQGIREDLLTTPPKRDARYYCVGLFEGGQHLNSLTGTPPVNHKKASSFPHLMPVSTPGALRA